MQIWAARWTKAESNCLVKNKNRYFYCSESNLLCIFETPNLHELSMVPSCVIELIRQKRKRKKKLESFSVHWTVACVISYNSENALKIVWNVFLILKKPEIFQIVHQLSVNVGSNLGLHSKCIQIIAWFSFIFSLRSASLSYAGLNQSSTKVNDNTAKKNARFFLEIFTSFFLFLLLIFCSGVILRLSTIQRMSMNSKFENALCIYSRVISNKSFPKKWNEKCCLVNGTHKLNKNKLFSYIFAVYKKNDDIK